MFENLSNRLEGIVRRVRGKGRLTEADVATARRVAADLVAMVEGGEAWWDEAWSRWSPPAGWGVPPAISSC